METLNKDVLHVLFDHLDDKSLFKACLINKRINNIICNDENFWRNRIFKNYSKTVSLKSETQSWRNFYLDIFHTLENAPLGDSLGVRDITYSLYKLALLTDNDDLNEIDLKMYIIFHYKKYLFNNVKLILHLDGYTAVFIGLYYDATKIQLEIPGLKELTFNEIYNFALKESKEPIRRILGNKNYFINSEYYNPNYWNGIQTVFLVYDGMVFEPYF